MSTHSIDRCQMNVWRVVVLFAAMVPFVWTAQGCYAPKHSPTPPSKIDTPILLFTGAGTSPNDVSAIQRLLTDHGLQYATATSEQLNEMSELTLSHYRLLIVPGGNYISICNSLSMETTAKVRTAVHNGLNYHGICAGGIIAGHTKYNSFDFTEGVHFDFYAAVNQGIHKTVVAITSKDAPTLDQYWEDGPQFTSWGQVVGKYPDDSAAVVQGSYGKGWLVLVGFHPEAPESWRKGMSFRTSARTDHEYAFQLIQSALEKAPLPYFESSPE